MPLASGAVGSWSVRLTVWLYDELVTYDEHDMAARVTQVLDEASGERLSPATLDRLDQFHAGGMDAVDRMTSALSLAAGQRVLDVGAGLGGPARRIADTTGATVVGVDINDAYLEAARLLTERCGLGGLVSFEHLDVSSAPTGDLFDAAITMHVQMSVADKVAWYRSIRKHLRPGGQLAIWEVCAVDPDRSLPLPLPWSMDGSDNHLVTPEALRSAISDAGFTVREWHDDTSWVNDWFQRSFAGGLPAGPSLPMILEQGMVRIINFAGSLDSHDLAIVRGTASN